MTDQTSIAQAPGLKAIFLYTKSAAIPAKGLQALIDAGYVPVRVGSLEDVKLLPLQVKSQITATQLDAVTAAALDAVLGGGETSRFGRGLAEALRALPTP